MVVNVLFVGRIPRMASIRSGHLIIKPDQRISLSLRVDGEEESIPQLQMRRNNGRLINAPGKMKIHL
jgi:hypothetical protein